MPFNNVVMAKNGKNVHFVLFSGDNFIIFCVRYTKNVHNV